MDNCTSKRYNCSLHSPLHTRQLECLLCSVPPTVQLTLDACQRMYHTSSTTHSTVFHNPPMLTTNTWHIVGKMAHNVGMGVKELWRHLHHVWLVFKSSIPLRLFFFFDLFLLFCCCCLLLLLLLGT